MYIYLCSFLTSTVACLVRSIHCSTQAFILSLSAASSHLTSSHDNVQLLASMRHRCRNGILLNGPLASITKAFSLRPLLAPGAAFNSWSANNSAKSQEIVNCELVLSAADANLNVTASYHVFPARRGTKQHLASTKEISKGRGMKTIVGCKLRRDLSTWSI